MYERAIAKRLQAGLADTPVILLSGPRQSGKSTLARHAATTPPGHPITLTPEERTPRPPGYITLDDGAVLASARSDAEGFLHRLPSTGLLVIDEVQRAPDLLVAIKRAVDLERRPGRFLLTGSANVLTLPQIAESLAGRMEPLALWPLAQCEIAGRQPRFLHRLFDGSLDTENTEGREALLERAFRGGFPEAVARTDVDRRNAWFGAYIATIVQREIKSISAIEDDSAIVRILQTLAARSGGPRNIQTLATDTGIPNTTINRYIALLRATFLVAEIPAWYRNIDARLVKSPKMLITDSGLYASLLRLDRDDAHVGLLWETFVGVELLRLISFEPAYRYSLLHFRTRRQHEVDYVIERGDRRIAGVEVKMARSVSASDFSGLRALQEAAGDAFHVGIILYAGERAIPFGKNCWAVPVNALWD